jgi:hypothetical protein
VRSLRFTIIDRNKSAPASGMNEAYLRIDHWNDYSFVTMFQVYLFDDKGHLHELGSLKIGFVGQTEDISTYSTLSENFDALKSDYFSLGTDISYYLKLSQDVTPTSAAAYLLAINDVVSNPSFFDLASEQRVWGTSLLRDVSLSAVNGQFRRVLDGGVPLTDFDFIYSRPQEDDFAGVELEFKCLTRN